MSEVRVGEDVSVGTGFQMGKTAKTKKLESQCSLKTRQDRKSSLKKLKLKLKKGGQWKNTAEQLQQGKQTQG